MDGVLLALLPAIDECHRLCECIGFVITLFHWTFFDPPPIVLRLVRLASSDRYMISLHTQTEAPKFEQISGRPATQPQIRRLALHRHPPRNSTMKSSSLLAARIPLHRAVQTGRDRCLCSTRATRSG